jgi:hypothetical protein
VSVVLCVVDTCRPIRGDHLGECDRADCPGCLPRTAEQPLAVCTACRLRALDRLTELGLGTVHAADADAESRTLPSLYEALLQPSRITSITRGARGDERPLAMSDDARQAREGIDRLLAEWCDVLRRNKWQTVHGRPMLTRRGHPLPRPTVAARTAHVLRHVRELLADPVYADQLVHDVDWAWTQSRRSAYPQPPTGYVVGPCPVGRGDDEVCGGEVRATIDTLDEDGWANCRTCGTSAVIGWWMAQMPAETYEWLPMKALQWHLTIRAGRQVPAVTIRSWARDPAVLPARVVGVVPFAGDVSRHSLGRVEYRVADALRLTELGRGRGRPPGVPRARRSVEDGVPA